MFSNSLKFSAAICERWNKRIGERSEENGEMGVRMRRIRLRMHGIEMEMREISVGM